ncbi:MAG TPA: trehalose-6-phosphate synthase [Actinomycetota bacterium]|nr:trehalose-6-phosphate synthase [Actinomycetota bacterium]
MNALDAPLIVASNRGPVTFEPGEDGELRPQRGSGGLVTALTGAMQSTEGLWVAAAMSEGDRARAGETGDGPIDVEAGDSTFRVRFVSIAPDVYDRYYNWIANGILWFVHHYLWDTVRSPIFGEDSDRAWEDFVEVNRMFAKVLAEEGARLPRPPVYLVQDYQLALVPRFLRELDPGALVAHFSHTPIAGPTYLRILPARIREGMLAGMLGADVLSFHAEAWAENFLMSARALPGARVDLSRSRVVYEGRRVDVRVHPISVEAEPMRALAATPKLRRLRRELSRWRGDAKLILRVDRLELTKNVVRGFKAFEVFLARYPEWVGNVRFLALLSPSRQELPEYRAYTDECLAEAERINQAYGGDGWEPVRVRVKEDHPRAIAAYGLYDVLLVNPVFDGMNLVAMEGPLVNRRHGVLVLSRNAGAYGRLGRYAIGINPFDVRETADAIHEALTMPEHERVRRARGLSRLVLANPLSRWVRGQLEDLERARLRRAQVS